MACQATWWERVRGFGVGDWHHSDTSQAWGWRELRAQQCVCTVNGCRGGGGGGASVVGDGFWWQLLGGGSLCASGRF